MRNMERTSSPTGDAIKRKLSLSDVADAFNISRPTLYKMIDRYDMGDYSGINGDLLRLFDIVSDEKCEAEDAQVYLLSYKKRDDTVSRNAPRSAMDRSIRSSAVDINRLANGVSPRERRTALEWSEGDVRTVSIGQNGRSMVVFNGPEGEYRLDIYLEISGKPFKISEYRQTPGRNYFLVDDLLPNVGYRFEVVCMNEDGETGSGLQELRLR